MIEEACLKLQDLQNTSSKNAKDDLLKLMEMSVTKEVYEFLFVTALSPLVNLGCQSFDDGQIHREDLPTLAELKSLRRDLESRKFTGGKAKAELQRVLLCKNKVVRSILIDTFTKKLRIGATETTINKIFKDLIPVFEIGLCETFEYVVGHTTELPKGNYYIEPKLDGLRCIIFIENGVVRITSRNDKPMYNTEIIEERLSELKLPDCVLDGEIKAKDWNETISIVHSQKKVDASALYFNCFDFIFRKEWDEQGTQPIESRKACLGKYFSTLPKNIRVVPYRNLPEKFSEAELLFKKLRSKGFEGAILKQVGSKYPFGRSSSWLKWKQFFTAEVLVQSLEEGSGSNKGKLGALVCDYKGTSVKVGGGFSKAERVAFWKNPKLVLGKLVEVKYFEVTRDGSLRFPGFLRIREDMN